MSAYLAIVRFNFLRFLAYPLEIVAVLLKRFLEISIFLLFWVVVAKSSGGTLQTGSLLSYFLISSSISAITMIGALRIAQRINVVVKNGSLSNYLIRPLSGIGYLAAETIGQMGPNYLVAAITLVIGIAIAPHQTPASLAMFAGFLTVALTVSFAINLLMGTLALHVTEGASYRHSVTHVIRIFSGAMVPLTLFPGWLRRLAELTPFPAVVFGPTNSLVHPELAATQLSYLMLAAVWGVGLTGLAFALWNRSLRTYDAVGI